MFGIKIIRFLREAWSPPVPCPHIPDGSFEFIWTSGECWTTCFCKRCDKIVEYWIRDKDEGPEWGMGKDNPFHSDPTWRKVTKEEWELAKEN